jgi:hypothetical protein
MQHVFTRYVARRKWLSLTVMIGCLALAPLMPETALAADSSGSSPDPNWVAAKQQMATEWSSYQSGQLSASSYLARASGFENQWKKFHAVAPRQRTLKGKSALELQQLAMAAGSSPQLMSCCTSNAVGMTQYPEELWYYCGPAAGKSALWALTTETLKHANTKSYNGEALSEACLAGSCGSGSPKSLKYLETNYIPNNGTPWIGYYGNGDYPMPGTFNYWLWGSYTGWYAPYHPTSVTNYENEFTFDIDTGYPVGADVEELVSTTQHPHPHLYNHPLNLEIEHWITIFAYGASGANTDYVDPASSSAIKWSPLPNPYDWYYPSSDMYTLVTDAGPNGGPYGLAW